jgi:HAD superfamily hydrolase (TIGR01509 family)
VRRRVPVYLFSNTSELHETYLFRRFPGFTQFTGGFYSWRLGAMKPGPGMYQAALTTLGLRGEEIAYIDDLPANIATGRSFGFHSLQYDRSRHHELEHFMEECGL